MLELILVETIRDGGQFFKVFSTKSFARFVEELLAAKGKNATLSDLTNSNIAAFRLGRKCFFFVRMVFVCKQTANTEVSR